MSAPARDFWNIYSTCTGFLEYLEHLHRIFSTILYGQGRVEGEDRKRRGRRWEEREEVTVERKSEGGSDRCTST
jgi:hypothetical protein